jgi:hypothetical protein
MLCKQAKLEEFILTVFIEKPQYDHYIKNHSLYVDKLTKIQNANNRIHTDNKKRRSSSLCFVLPVMRVIRENNLRGWRFGYLLIKKILHVELC